MKTNSRNSGIDLLRLIAMFLVVLGHVLAKGNILNSLTPFTLKYELLWLLKIISVCAVNIYGIISGYVGIDTKPKYSNLIYLWIGVIVYSFGITLLFKALGYDVGNIELIRSLFPATQKIYWYFSAYIGVFLVSPLLNNAINSCSEKQLKIVLISLLCVFSVVETFSFPGGSLVEYGYSIFWLIILYLIGAMLKKHKSEETKNCRKYIAAIVCCVLILFAIKLITELATSHLLGYPDYGNLFMEYTSPPVIVMSICMVKLFAALPSHNAQVISKLSSLSFYVYIIHMHPMFLDHIIQNKLSFIVDQSTFMAVLTTLGIALAIFTGCMAIEFARNTFFNLLKIKPKLIILEHHLFDSIGETHNT